MRAALEHVAGLAVLTFTGAVLIVALWIPPAIAAGLLSLLRHP